jgi:hypothetical protein
MEAEKKASVVSLMVLVVCPVLLILTNSVQAVPVVENVTISPPNPWIGWNVGITAECNDSTNGIETVYANISGPGMSFSNLGFGHISGVTYGIVMQGSDLSGTGEYEVRVGCTNDAGEESQDSGSFRVSELTGEITEVTDILGYGENGVVYTEEYFDVYFLARKDSVPITTGLDFRVVLNNEGRTIQEPIPYVTGKGHRLRMTAPENDGNYMLEVDVGYHGEDVSDEMLIEVRELMKLEIMSIEKATISKLEPITVNLKATERGVPLAIKEQDISITINSTDIEIDSITQSGETYVVEFMPPNLLPGSYTLEVEFSRDGNTRRLERKLTYTIPVSGEISHNGKGLNVLLRFDDDGVTTTFQTDAAGMYSGALSPGTYDVILEHKESKITFHDVDVEEFDDPIKYSYLGVVGVSGIKNAGLFVYETALSYSHTTMELHYKEKSVEGPESMLEVYRCADWNGEECFSEWEEVDSVIDTVRDIASVTADSLSAYTVGIREGISIEIGIDKESYNFHESLLLDGIVTHGDNKKLSDALITAKIEGTSKSKTARTNSDGIFSLELTVPEDEGEHVVEVTVEKDPFSAVTATERFTVVKSKGVSISIPSGIKIEVLKNKTIEFSVKNTGQLALTDVKISVEDIPESIAAILDTEGTEELSPDEEVSLLIEFTSLSNVTKTHTMKVLVDSKEGVSAEKTIALTTERRNPVQPSGSGADTITGGNAFEALDFSLIGNAIVGISGGFAYLLAIFVGSVSFALIMRKKRLSRVMEREWIKHKLSSMRLEISKPESADGAAEGHAAPVHVAAVGNVPVLPETQAPGAQAPNQSPYGAMPADKAGARTPLEDIAYSVNKPAAAKRPTRRVREAKTRATKRGGKTRKAAKARKPARTIGKKHKSRKQKK